MCARSYIVVLPWLFVLACGDDPERRSDADATTAPADTAETSEGDTVAPDGDVATDAEADGETSPSVACGAELTADELASGSWDDRFTISGFTGHDGYVPFVHDFAFTPDGALVAAGDWEWLGTTEVEPVMQWKDGAWQPLRSTWELVDAGAGFAALAIGPAGELALATNDTFGERDGAIWLDDGDGLTVIGQFTGQVRGMAWYGGDLWVAGLFSMGTGSPEEIQGLAIWDGTVWHEAIGGGLVGGADPNRGFAFELTEHDGDLYVGGAFDGIGGIPAANIASWDGTAWTAHDLPDAPAVYALGFDGEVMYAGGAIGDRGAGGGGVVRRDGDGWELIGGGMSAGFYPGVVTDIVPGPDGVDMVGCFDQLGGAHDAPGNIMSRDVARWTDAGWVALQPDGRSRSPWFMPLACGDESVTAIFEVPFQRAARVGTRLFVGGAFPAVADVQSQSVIALDGTTWEAQGASGLGVTGALDHLEASGDCTLYATGDFGHVGGVASAARMVRFDGDRWTSLTDPLPADAYCTGFAAGPDGAALGCMEFSDSGAVGRVLVTEGDALVPLALDLELVQALAYTSSGKLWVGGVKAADGTGFVGVIDDGAFTLVEDGFNGGITRFDVVSETEVVIGGDFSELDGAASGPVVRYDGATFTALGALPGQLTAIGHDAAGSVYASTVDMGGGFFVLARHDGSTWQELATPATNLTAVKQFNFNRIRAVGDALVLVGSAELDDDTGRGALVYRDGRFAALGGGVGAIGLSGLAVTDDAIWIGGLIAEAGRGEARTPTVGVARWVIDR